MFKMSSLHLVFIMLDIVASDLMFDLHGSYGDAKINLFIYA